MILRKQAAIGFACLVALLVAILFPKQQWVLNRQIKGLSTETDEHISSLRRVLSYAHRTPVQPPRVIPVRIEIEEVAKVADQEPLLANLRMIADYTGVKPLNIDPNNNTGVWSMATRRSALWSNPNHPEKQNAIFLNQLIASHLRRPQDTQLRLLSLAMAKTYAVRFTAPHGFSPVYHGRLFREVKNLLRVAAINIDKGGDFAKYENEWETEREAILRTLERLESYSGQDRVAEVDRIMDFSDAAALKQLPLLLLPDADLQMRKDLAKIAANLVSQGDPAILMIVGRSMLADTIKPEGATYREPHDYSKLVGWARARDAEFKTGDYFTKLVMNSGFVVNLPGEMKERPNPLYYGSGLLCVLLAMGAGFAFLVRLSQYSADDSIVKMRCHLLAALGWLLALVLLPDIGSALFGLIAVSHVGLAFAVLDKSTARFGTTMMALVSFIPVFNSEDETTATSFLLIAVFFCVIAGLSWMLSQEKRWRFGLLAGWAVTLVCFGFTGVGLATLLPAAGWIIGLMLETRKGPATINQTVAVMFITSIASAVIYMMHPGWMAGFTGLSLSFVAATIVYRTHRLTIIGAAMICAATFMTAYVCTVAWSLRYDRENEAMIESYLNEAQRLRGG